MSRAGGGASRDDDGVSRERDGVSRERDGVSRERDGVSRERDGVSCERDGVSCERDGVSCERDGVSCERDGVSCERDGASRDGDGVSRDGDGVSCDGDGVSCGGGGVNRVAKMRARRGWVWLGVSLLALLPSFGVLKSAFAQEEEGPIEGEASEAVEGGVSVDLGRRQRAILEALPKDASALVNVSGADMPASPDILNLGRRATPALARCVADNVDDGVRATCAMVLGRLGDRRGLTALQEALEAWAPGVRTTALAALVRIPDASSFMALSNVLAREDETPENRLMALSALGMLSDQRAVQLLRKVLHDEKRAELHSAAFQAAWKSRHLFARQTLVGDVKFALGSGDYSLVLAGTFAAAELRDPALVPALVPLMNNSDSHTRNRAVFALGRIGDKAASSALVAQIPKVREARMLNNIAFALERLDPKAFFAAIQGLSQHKQASIRMNAAFVLGDVRRPEGLPLLERALKDQNDFVRVSAIAALGKLDAPEAIPLVMPFTSDKNRTLKKTALFSLLSLSNGEKRDVVYNSLVAVPSGDSFTEQARLEAVLALAALGDRRVLDSAVECLEQHRCARSAVEPFLLSQKTPALGGRMLLAWVKGRNDLTNLVAALRPAGTGLLAASEARALGPNGYWSRLESAVDLVGAVGEKQALDVLGALAKHQNTALRLHASVALARLAQPSADAAVFADFDNLPGSWLPRFSRVLSIVDDQKVRERWQPALLQREKSADRSIALASASVRMAWQPDPGVFRFLEGLASNSAEERELSMGYLQRDQRPLTTSLLRRAFAREGRPFVRDLLRKLLDSRRGATGVNL
ncbi:MAG: HEAT repeat domain-containing protein [Myxococcota bacterium]